MTRLLFLDIDGVLNVHEQMASGYAGIDFSLAMRLNDILDAFPDMGLVITSSWRELYYEGHVDLRGFEHMLAVCGVKAHMRIHGFIRRWDDVHEPKAYAINEYLIHNHPDKFLVVDDDDLMLGGIANFGFEHFLQVDGHQGLSTENVSDIIDYLAEPIGVLR